MGSRVRKCPVENIRNLWNTFIFIFYKKFAIQIFVWYFLKTSTYILFYICGVVIYTILYT